MDLLSTTTVEMSLRAIHQINSQAFANVLVWINVQKINTALLSVHITYLTRIIEFACSVFVHVYYLTQSGLSE